jgi:hypothetical protein
VFDCEPAQAYDAAVHEQISAAVAVKGLTDINSLLRSGATWTAT